MKKLCIVLSVIMLVLILNMIAYAGMTLNDVNVDYTKGTITVSGSLGLGNSGLNLSIEVTDTKANTAYVDQIKSVGKGNFKKEFKLNRYFKTDTYTVKVTGDAISDIKTFTIDQTKDIFSISNVNITGATAVNTTFTAYEGVPLNVTYDYFSSFGYNIGDISYTWQASGSQNGTYYDIENATSVPYSFQLSDAQKLVLNHPEDFSTKAFFIRCSVKVKSEVSDGYCTPVVSNNSVALTLLPVASDVTVSGSGTSTVPLKGSYTYADFQNKTEKDSMYRWLRSSTPAGTYVEVAKGQFYITSKSDEGSYIKFEVTPKALNCEVAGVPVQSSNDFYVPVTASNPISSSPRGGGGGIAYPTVEPVKLVPKVEEPKTSQFTDVNNHYWASKDIAEIVARKDANGVSETEFCPELFITRAEFSKLIINTLNKDLIPYNDTFADVKTSDWFSSIVETINNLHIASGSNGDFRPNANVTREEMAKMIIGAYKIAHPNAELKAGDKTFNDAKDISSWAKEDVNVATSLGVINGMPDGSFAPSESATRAQAVVVINRLYKLINELTK